MTRKNLPLSLAAALLFSGCGDITVTWNEVRTCKLHLEDGFPTNANFETNISIGCPVVIPYPVYEVRFSVDALFDPNSVTHHYLFNQYDAYHLWRGSNTNVVWTSPGGYERLAVTGTYYAGSAGFYPSGAAATDYLVSQVQPLANGGYVKEETLDAAYGTGPAATIAGPSEVIGLSRLKVFCVPRLRAT